MSITYQSVLPTGDWVTIPINAKELLVRANNGVFYSGFANCFGNINWKIADVKANENLSIDKILGN